MFKFLLAPFLAVSSLFHPQPKTTFEQMIAKVENATVFIHGTVETPFGEGRYSCTGFFIAAYRVITAAHCSDGEDMTADGYPIKVLRIDPYYDLAVWEVPFEKPFLSFRDAPVVRFEEFEAVGHAWGFRALSVLHQRAYLIDWHDEEVAPELAVMNLYQGGFIGGMSGGPIVDMDGQVVGVVQMSGEGVGLGIGTLLIRAFLLGT